MITKTDCDDLNQDVNPDATEVCGDNIDNNCNKQVDEGCVTGVDLTSGLVAYYPFNGNANDESGNVNNGVVHGATLTTDRFGNQNRAYNFDGVDDYLQIGNAASLNFGTSDFTLSCWINTNISPSPAVALIDKRTSSGGGFVLYYNDNNNTAYGKVGIQLGNGSAYTNFNSQNTELLQSSKWYHLLVSVDRDSQTGMKLYVNGQLTDTFNPTAYLGSIDNLGDLLIGINSISPTSYPHFKGTMDDIRIYNRALSGTEVGALHSEAAPADLSVPGTFAATGSMNAVRYTPTATVLNDGRVLIAGGTANNNSPLPSAEVYSPATGVFSMTGNMTTARQAHTATLLQNGKVLIAGGVNALSPSYSYLRSAEIYDPATGIFTATGNMNTPRLWHRAVSLLNGKVLIVGGFNNAVGISSAELYDPTTGSFANVPNMLCARYWFGANLLPNGKVLIVGGATTGAVGSAELYDPVSNTFSVTGGMVANGWTDPGVVLPSGKVLFILTEKTWSSGPGQRR